MSYLNDTQRDIVSENHGLIHHMLKKMNLQWDEWYDVAAIGLCQAAMKFDITKGYSFATFACTCIRNKILVEINAQHYQKRYCPMMYSLDSVIDPIAKTTYKDIIEDTNFSYSSSEWSIDFEIYTKNMKEIDRKILTLLWDGHTQSEIAAMVGISVQAVNQHVFKIRDALVDIKPKDIIGVAHEKKETKKASNTS